MAQNNLYMEDDDMRLYIDVQPLFIDELENSKNAAAVSAAQAAQSEEKARGWKNDIEDYKTGLELFYAQATDGLENSYEDLILDLTNAKNSAISNISSSAQGYINQAKYYAEQAQTVVDNNVIKDRINQAKGLQTGAVSTSADVLADVKNYAHSTYCGDQPGTASPLDPKKFVKAGSPVITDDGIACGFSENDYITFTNLNFSFSKPFSVRFKFRSKISTYPQTFFSGEPTQGIFLAGLAGTNNNQPIVYYPSDNTSYFYLNSTISDNTDYIFNIDFDGTMLSASVLTTDGVVVSTGSRAVTYTGNITNKFIGRNVNGTQISAGSIDLKWVNISVDGVPVFSGNKTGKDTIKQDDFYVNTYLYAWVYSSNTIYANGLTPTALYNADGSSYTGSDWSIQEVDGVNKVFYGENEAAYTSGSNIAVTSQNTSVDAGYKITEDGIFISNSANSNIRSLVSTDIVISDTRYWEIQCPFVIKEVIPNSRGYFIGGGTDPISSGGGVVDVQLDTSNRLTSIFQLRDGSNNHVDVRTQFDNVPTTIGTKYFVKLGRKDTTFYTELWVNGEYIDKKTITSDLNMWSSTGNVWFGNYRLSYSRPIYGEIDLNLVKIYKNGNLVYQPCLKIPFTESKTGSKVVNFIYRDRVKGMYEQFGYAPYYTLDENNGNFTLPMGEVYGMIEKLRELIIQISS